MHEKDDRGSPARQYRRFTARNEGFQCIVCDTSVPPASSGYRNHCPRCLSSLHVDRFPGDRAEACAAIMDPVGLSRRHGAWVIAHRCRACGRVRNNTVAADDVWERLVEVSTKPTALSSLSTL